MPGVEVRVIDEHNYPCPVGTVGEIAVKRHDEWLRTGDEGYVDDEGYFWYKGRKDDLIKTSGYRIGPEEIEAVLNSHSAVAESAVVGAPDQSRGQIIKAFIKLKTGYVGNEIIAREITMFAREKLGLHAYPREIRFVNELPRTIDGKIRRKDLLEKENKLV